MADNLRITLVARECKDYTDVMANKARNNIMESLRNLGPNSVYTGRQLVAQSIEDGVASQVAGCVPLNNWQFSLGDKISSSKDIGAFGELSKVAVQKRVTQPTENDVVVRGPNGAPTGARVDGAVTIELNSEEASLASRGRLTVQGGKPGDPLLGSQVLGFASLRCGNDNQNADNIEFARFPSPTSHIFCYAYYINPAPTAAKIIINKRVENSSASDVSFPFAGNTSFNAGGTFSLNNGGTIDFDRAAVTGATPEWVISENIAALPNKYSFARIECSSDLGSVYTITGSQVSIRLLGGDTVRCTFVNRVVPEISPILECTARSGPQAYSAHWGYFNRGSSEAPVPPGALNFFSPPPQNRGQPFTFQVGRKVQVFDVDHSGGPLTWSLTGRTATSSSVSAQRCKPTCILPPEISIPQCSRRRVIDGTLSGTLNNNGKLSGLTWTSTCPGSFLQGDTLRPTFVVDLGRLPQGGTTCKVSLTVTDDTRYGSSDPREVQTSSCSSEVTIPACRTDCAGIPNGSSEVDDCGVCGGNSSTCLDCAGITNGGAAIDQCGVCGGNNQSCSDCAGVPNGSAALDACGVCGGDGSSCAQLCPPGIDTCGICGGDGTSCQDCAGVPNGTTEVDACGVCGGDGSSCAGVCRITVDLCGVCGGNNSSCRDCAGIPNGTAQFDVCGVCGGDGSTCAPSCSPGLDACGVCGGTSSTCGDCAGIPNGKTELDECGVCGGDGSSCSSCVSDESVSSKDSALLKQVGSRVNLLLKNATRYFNEAIRCKPAVKRELLRRIERIAALSNTISDLIQEDLTKVTNQCSNGHCAVVSIIEIKREIELLATSLRNLSRASQLVVSKCRAPIESNNETADSRALLAEIKRILDRVSNTAIACTPG